MNDDFSASSANRRFATTSWSTVLLAQGNDSGERKAALHQLCTAYWYPLYAFLRRSGNDANRAADLTQDFFTELLEKQVLVAADHRRGRFRSFLLATLNHFVANNFRKENAQKRGGGRQRLSLDFADADQRFQNEVSHQDDPHRHFVRQWALTILELAADSLAQQYRNSGKENQFQVLRQFLSPGSEIPYADVASQLGMQEGAVKVAVHRIRQRYGQELRLQIAQTVEYPDDVDQELKELFIALGS